MKTALLVDDNDELRGATGEILEEMGYVIIAAAHAEEAMGVPNGFDLLVSDVHMPGLTGIELADRLLARQPELAVLLISSRGGEAEVSRRLAQGDVAFLPKPFSPGEVTVKVQEAFDRVSERHNTRAARSVAGATSSGQVSGQVLENTKQRHEPTDSRFRLPRGALQLVGAVILVLGLGALLRGFDFGAPPLPAPSIESPTRGATIEIVQPLGPLAAAPTRLIWLPTDGAVTYSVSLRTIDGSALWQAAIVSPPVDVPAKITHGLHQAVTYYWSVEALDAEGKLLGRSELAPFVIEPNGGTSVHAYGNTG